MLTGIVIEFESSKRTGLIKEGNGKEHLLQPNSFRKKTRLRKGDKVSFTSWNLFDGACARDVEAPTGSTSL